MTGRRIFLLTILLALTSFLTAQEVVHGASCTAADEIIDGAVHPELIPDSSAFRLWFSSVSLPENQTTDQQAIQRRQLSSLRLDDGDFEVVTQSIAAFRKGFSALISEQNSRAEQDGRALRTTDNSRFLADRDTLVISLINNLKAQLSPTGWATVSSHVTEEKKNMKLSPVTR